MKCVNLMERFPKNRVIRTVPGTRDPWNFEMLCKYGHIFPSGENELGAATDRRGIIANKLAALDCATRVQHGDDGTNIYFDVADFRQIAKIIKPRQKRKMSAEHKAKLLAGHAAYLSGIASKGPQMKI